jgi:hypothetical protein
MLVCKILYMVFFFFFFLWLNLVMKCSR